MNAFKLSMEYISVQENIFGTRLEFLLHCISGCLASEGSKNGLSPLYDTSDL